MSWLQHNGSHCPAAQPFSPLLGLTHKGEREYLNKPILSLLFWKHPESWWYPQETNPLSWVSTTTLLYSAGRKSRRSEPSQHKGPKPHTTPSSHSLRTHIKTAQSYPGLTTAGAVLVSASPVHLSETATSPLAPSPPTLGGNCAHFTCMLLHSQWTRSSPCTVHSSGWHWTFCAILT